jgi:integrase
VVKASTGSGGYWTKRIADADDFDESDGKSILTFYEAQDRAKQLARGGSAEADTTAPITVDRALDDYKRDLIARGASAYNADYPRRQLTPNLSSKPVALLATRELRLWRDGLLSKVSAATINRINNGLCAGLELAAQHDPRIRNQDAWRVGLSGLPDAQQARNVVLSDAKVLALIDGAYAKDQQLGLLIDVLATTGARPSQATRLRVEDLRDPDNRPKLMMPKSGKGGGRNRSAKKEERYSVPITIALAKRLSAAAAGRAADAALLARADGSSWGAVNPAANYRRAVREIVEAIGEDPGRITMYCLRHSSIVRMLLKNIPIRLAASLHDTSVGQIERNYSRFITEHHTDDLARASLLSEPAPAAVEFIHEDKFTDNVVALVR